MAFDPSALQDIQPPDIAGGVARGFQLKDMVDTQQLNALKLKGEKQTLADDERAKDILSGSDLSTDAGRAAAQEKLTKGRLPGKAMELGKYSQTIKSGELDNKLKEVDLRSASHDIIANSVDAIYQQATAMKNAKNADGRPKYTDASVDAFIQGQIPGALASIQSDSGLPEDVRKMAISSVAPILQQTGGKMTYDQLSQYERTTKQGQAILKSQREDLVAQTGAKKADIADRSEQEHERHDRAMEKGAQAKNAGFTDTESDLLAALADKNVSLPAGLRSQSQIKSTVDGLLRKHPELNPDQIAEGIKSGKLKLAAETKGAQTAGTQIGKVALAANELETFGDQTLEASKAVPRGKFVPYGRLKQMGEGSISDPALLRFKTKMQALENAYNQLAARSGTDVDKRAHIHELFNTANSDEAVQTLVKSLREEATGAKDAADRTIAETSGSSIPGTGTTPQSPAAGAPKVLKFDAKGNPVT